MHLFIKIRTRRYVAFKAEVTSSVDNVDIASRVGGEMSRKASVGEFRAQAGSDHGRVLQMKINMLADERQECGPSLSISGASRSA